MTFLDSTTTLGTGTVNSGQATYTTAALAAGTHSVTASFGGEQLLYEQHLECTFVDHHRCHAHGYDDNAGSLAQHPRLLALPSR